MNESGLAVRGQQAGILPAANEWNVMLDMADVLVKSGMLPQHIKTPAAAVAVIQKGRELGIAPMYSLSNIVVIQGKPTANAELMAAMIYRDHGDGALVYEETDGERCVISYARRAWKDRKTYAFTMDDAKKAGLLTNQTWQKYPAAMLRARCVSAVARLAFPDTIGGMYTPEELGAAVDVDADGVVQYTAPAAPEPIYAPQLPPPAPAGPDLDGPMCEKTRGAIHATGHQKGWSHDLIHDYAAHEFGVQSLNDLTERQARAVGRYLKDLPDPAPAAVIEQEQEDEGYRNAAEEADARESADEQPELLETAVGPVKRTRTAQSA